MTTTDAIRLHDILTSSSLLINAGPGSGKTLLVEPIVYLITHKSNTAEGLLVVTINVKVAAKLQMHISRSLKTSLPILKSKISAFPNAR